MTRAECTQHCSVTDHTDQEGKLPLALLLSNEALYTSPGYKYKYGKWILREYEWILRVSVTTALCT